MAITRSEVEQMQAEKEEKYQKYRLEQKIARHEDLIDRCLGKECGKSHPTDGNGIGTFETYPPEPEVMQELRRRYLRSGSGWKDLRFDTSGCRNGYGRFVVIPE